MLDFFHMLWQNEMEKRKKKGLDENINRGGGEERRRRGKRKEEEEGEKKQEG